MLLKYISYWHTLKQLLIRSFIIYKPEFKHKIINALIVSGLHIIVYTYIMPSLGLINFGPFILFTSISTLAFFSAINNLPAFIMEITNEENNLKYELTLPIPQWLIFFKYAIVNSYQGLITAFFVLPVGKLLLWNIECFTYFSTIKFLVILIISSIFFGLFSIFIASITATIYTFDDIWIRIIFPMWFLGGFQFSWKNLYAISPIVAYINFLNPLMYVLEGIRSASLDPTLSLPYWICIIVLILASLLFGYIGIHNLKKRLDCF